MALNGTGFLVKRIIQPITIAATGSYYSDSLLLLDAWVVSAICSLIGWGWKDGLRRLLYGERDARAPRSRAQSAPSYAALLKTGWVALGRLHTELGLLAGDGDSYAVDALHPSAA